MSFFSYASMRGAILEARRPPATLMRPGSYGRRPHFLSAHPFCGAYAAIMQEVQPFFFHGADRLCVYVQRIAIWQTVLSVALTF